MELDMDLARRAYAAISHVPEQRAEQERADVEANVAALARDLDHAAQTDEQRAQATIELARYRAAYIKWRHAILAAKSRTMSPMIIGPARFPVERNNKRLDAEMDKVERFLAWQGRARAAAIKAVKAAEAPPAPPAAPPVKPELVAEGPGVEAWRDRDLDRLQRYFTEKPGEEVRARLKGSGWHWSPSQGAWQRKITPNAEANLAAFLAEWPG